MHTRLMMVVVFEFLKQANLSKRMQWRFILASCMITLPAPAQAERIAVPVSQDSSAETREITLSLDEGSWMSVDVSPDGKMLAFDLLNDIYLLPVTGGEAVPVHTGSATQRSPKFSPDGKQLAFISDEDGADNIWVSSLDGSEARAVTSESLDILAAPSWSHDGNSLYAMKMRDNALYLYSAEINRYDLETGAETPIIPIPDSRKDVQEPQEDPNSGDLWYTERAGGGHFVFVNTAEGVFSINRRNAQTGEIDKVISGLGGATTPQPSPDGKSVAFIRRVGAKTVLFRYDVESRAQSPIYAELDRDLHADYVQHDHYFPAFDWFPDNRHVAIWGKGKLLKVDMQSGAAEPIPFRVNARHHLQEPVRAKQDVAPDTISAKVIRTPALSPDGEHLVYRAVGRLWWEQDGQSPRQLTDETNVAQHDPTWSPDGEWLAYVSWHDEKGSELRVRRISDGEERVLATSRAMLRTPKFAPGRDSIAYYAMGPDSSYGGHREEPGVYVVSTELKQPSTSRSPRIADAAGLLGYSSDGGSILYFGTPDYYAGRAVRLLKADLAGVEPPREIAFGLTADTADIRLSPDGRWVAFKHEQQLYLAPFSEGPEAVHISPAMEGARQLTTGGGFEPSWSTDSQRLNWVLGNAITSVSPPLAEDLATWRVSLNLPVERSQKAIAFVGARIIPMTEDAEIIENGTVVVRGNEIVEVGKSAEVEVPAEAQRFDVSGKTIMPGLFNAHGHIDCCFGANVMPVKQPTRYAALAFGVTTNFDPYANELTGYESAEMTDLGVLVGPRWLSAGQVAYGRAGRPDGPYQPLDTLEKARAFVARKVAVGGAIIKSYKLMTRAQRQYLLQASREADVMVDAEGASFIADNIGMILDGHTNLEHNIPVANYYADLTGLLAASGISHTPTLIVTFGELFGENYIYQTTKSWDHPKLVEFVPDVNNAYNPMARIGGASPYVRGSHTIHYADELYDIGWRSVGRSMARLDELGVPINVGSHGQSSGIAMHWEMRLLAEAGMPIMRVLRGATIVPARSFGFDHAIGSLEPGKLADLIVLDKNPLEDIRNTDSVRYTMIDGRLYDAESMDRIAPTAQPRGKFFWETDPEGPVDWKSAWEKQ